MIDRYLLRYFLAVVDHGNFSRAAAACNVTQPTLSVGIAKLEALLDHQLFRRTNRRVELTEAGARLAAHARSIEAEFLTAERAVRDSLAPRTLRLGVLTSLPVAWIEAMMRGYPGEAGRVEIVEGRAGDLTERLARGRLDLALTLIRDADRKWRAEPLFTEGYRLIAPPDHRCAALDSVDAGALAGEPMIVRRHCELLAETSRFFTARGVRPFFPARTTSDDRALAHVRAGLGVTVMPACFAGDGVAGVPLKDFGFMRTIGLLFADAGPALRESALADAIRREVGRQLPNT